MGQNQIRKGEKEAQEHLKDISSIYMNIIFQLLRLFASSLGEEILRKLTTEITRYTFEKLNEEYARKSAAKTNSENRGTDD